MNYKNSTNQFRQLYLIRAMTIKKGNDRRVCTNAPNTDIKNLREVNLFRDFLFIFARNRIYVYESMPPVSRIHYF